VKWCLSRLISVISNQVFAFEIWTSYLSNLLLIISRSVCHERLHNAKRTHNCQHRLSLGYHLRLPSVATYPLRPWRVRAAAGAMRSCNGWLDCGLNNKHACPYNSGKPLVTLFAALLGYGRLDVSWVASTCIDGVDQKYRRRYCTLLNSVMRNAELH